jgi:hypothetical protein
VALPGDGDVGVAKPVQEHDGAACEPASQQGLLLSGGTAAVAASLAPEQVPDQVAVQDLPPLGVVLGSQQACEVVGW